MASLVHPAGIWVVPDLEGTSSATAKDETLRKHASLLTDPATEHRPLQLDTIAAEEHSTGGGGAIELARTQSLNRAAEAFPSAMPPRTGHQPAAQGPVLLRARDAHWNPYTYSLVMIGFAMLLGFHFYEKRIARPLIPNRLWQTPRFTALPFSYFLGLGAYSESHHCPNH